MAPWEIIRHEGLCGVLGCSSLLSSGGYVYYTAVVTKSGDMLSGFYSSSVPFSPADQAVVILRRIGN